MGLRRYKIMVADVSFHEKGKKSLRRRRHDSDKYKRRLRFLSSFGGYPSGAYYNRSKGRYIRTYRDKFSGWFKRYANRVVRRYDKHIYNGSGYKKVYDYWWTIT